MGYKIERKKRKIENRFFQNWWLSQTVLLKDKSIKCLKTHFLPKNLKIMESKVKLFEYSKFIVYWKNITSSV